ncbi:hypothetical protein halTADL_1702 [Halohasta litchfieldiae]|jgi:hypothetical protein|uniref:DUF7964 domain-containing protein n=1 Tax=Halohasta litchfieldiae TaxID=1073996 RepID=A0A1H6RAW6_9EURY|nr:hypothetical protein [Halohasta litchfieldiae]ATW88457.1 hypothetical protein halTADL_1702 [Halohasta litchfieldiae]SEI50384.1 hypothetical protein SAMN05444271_101265 [Halohasta litchfieldiae]
MALTDLLPDRPLQQSEVDALDDSEKIVGNFPVYLEQASRFAIGLVLVVGDTAHALSYDVEGEGWELIETCALDHPVDGGVHVDDMDLIEELQSTASQHAGASA